MTTRLDTPARRQITAFGLAAMLTLAMLAGANTLATQAHADELQMMAAKAAGEQVIVIEGKRTTRS